MIPELIRFAVRHNLITPQMMQRDPLWLRTSAYAHGRMPHELQADLDWLDGIYKKAIAPPPEKPYRRRAEVYAMKDGKILTGLIGDSFMTFGGGIDDGEDAATAAARELEEETGYRVKGVRPLGPPLIAEFADEKFDKSKLSPKQIARRNQYRGNHSQCYIANIDGEPTKACDPSNAKKIDFRDIPTLRKILAKADQNNPWTKHHLDRFQEIEQYLQRQRLIQLLQQQLQQRQSNGLTRNVRGNRLVQG